MAEPMNRFGSFILLSLSLSGPALAQQSLTEHTMRANNDSQRAAAVITDVSWLGGRWVGEGLGGTCEEMWTAPLAGHMLGTFRLIKDEALDFSEFFMMAEENGSLTLKLKHFGPNLDGWEAKDKYVTFRLIKVEGKTAWFDGLTYALDDDDVLHSYVAIKQKDGQMHEGEFRFTRAE
jgi:hypothetical protein